MAAEVHCVVTLNGHDVWCFLQNIFDEWDAEIVVKRGIDTYRVASAIDRSILDYRSRYRDF